MHLSQSPIYDCSHPPPLIAAPVITSPSSDLLKLWFQYSFHAFDICQSKRNWTLSPLSLSLSLSPLSLFSMYFITLPVFFLTLTATLLSVRICNRFFLSELLNTSREAQRLADFGNGYVQRWTKKKTATTIMHKIKTLFLSRNVSMIRRLAQWHDWPRLRASLHTEAQSSLIFRYPMIGTVF